MTSSNTTLPSDVVTEESALLSEVYDSSVYTGQPEFPVITETDVECVRSEEDELLLLRRITANRGMPQDYWELSALLETDGLRDCDARTDWGELDIFCLAKRLFKRVDELSYEQREIKVNKKALVIRITKNYCKGAVFALPMMLQILSMLVVGFGVWSYVHFSLRQATAVALGTLLALSVTGGISQIIGRKGFYYIKMEETLLAAKVTKGLMLAGVILVVMYGVVFFLLNSYFKLFPADMFQLFFCYYLLLSFVLVVFSVFYMLENFGSIAILVLLGIASTYLCFSVFRIGIVYSQYISLTFMLAVSCSVIFFKLRRLERKSMAAGYVFPSMASLFYSLYPYFGFGTAYFLFIIMDRILAWTTGNTHLPYFFWFNYPYEVGVDWALFPLIFTLALVEVCIYELGVMAFNRISGVPAMEVDVFNGYFLRLYGWAGVVFIVVGAASILVSYLLPFWMETAGYEKYVAGFFGDIHQLVFFCASIAYVLLSWSLLNCIVFFSYSRPEFALKSLGLGLFANFLVGFFFSRALNYYYSVLGLLIGAIVFAFFSTIFAIRLFKRYDYYYYSSF